MADNGGSWFLAGGIWYKFYGERTDGRILPLPDTNMTNLIGCSTASVKLALEANSSFYHYGEKSRDVFYIGKDKYQLNTNRPDGSTARISNWNGGTDFGEDCKYKACALHIYMRALNLDPTVEGTRQGLSHLTDGGKVEFAKNGFEKRKIEREISSAYLAAGKRAPVFMESVSVMPDLPAGEKGIHYSEVTLAVYAENARRVAEAIKVGEIEFPALNPDGSYYVPKVLAQMLRGRGIDPYAMPFDELAGIGICYGSNKYLRKNGVRFQSSKGEDFKYPARGLAFMQDMAKDDDGHNFLSIQIRNSTWDYVLITKEIEKVQNFRRFMNVGPAAPIGAEKSLEKPVDVPVMILEGAFDKYSVSDVSGGTIAAIATQGAKNHRYILANADEYREQGRVVILAYDDDETGIKANKELKEEFLKKGVMVFTSCGCLGAKDYNELLQRNRAEATSLAGVLVKTARLFKIGYWTLEAANAFTAEALGSASRYGSGGNVLSQTDYVEYVMRNVSDFCRNGGRIQDVERALDSIFPRLQLPGMAIAPMQGGTERPQNIADVERNNLDIFREAAGNGDIMVAALGSYDFMSAYWDKGVFVEKLPVDIMRKLGFSGQRGIYPISPWTFERSMRPLFGVVMKYDDINGSSSYRISEMSRTAGKNNRLYYTHENGKEYTVGSPGIFGLEHAAAVKKNPIVITENVFDALRIMSVSGGRVNAIAVERKINALPEEYIEKIKEHGNPIILAVEMTEASTSHFNELGNNLTAKGCTNFFTWPVCPEFDNIEKLQKDDMSFRGNVMGRKLSLLTDSIAKLSAMAETGRFDNEKTQAFIKAITAGRRAIQFTETPEVPLAQNNYVSTILYEMQHEMEYQAAQNCNTTEARAAMIETVLEKSIRLFDLALGRVAEEKQRQKEEAMQNNSANQYYAAAQQAQNVPSGPYVSQQAQERIQNQGWQQNNMQAAPEVAMNEGDFRGVVYSVGEDCTFAKTDVSYRGVDADSIPYNPSTRDLKKTAKMANSAALAENYCKGYPNARVLEISTKSSIPLGIKLSAMNLDVTVGIGEGEARRLVTAKVESLYQGSKVFEQSGVHSEWYELRSWDAKKEAGQLHKAERLVGFSFDGKDYPPRDGSLFYNWLYIRGLTSIKNTELRKELLEGGWNAFTDIESRTGQYACQAEGASIFLALAKSGQIGVLMDFDKFRDAVNSLRRKGVDGVSQEQTQEQGFGISDTAGTN